MRFANERQNTMQNRFEQDGKRENRYHSLRMNEVEMLARRVPQETIVPEEMLAERSRILAEHRLTLEREFDTFRKESGRKDVVTARTETGERVIVRLGERRPSWLFPEGFVGTSIRIPRLIASGGDRIPFEIEEAIEGTMMVDLDRATESLGQLSDTTLKKLAAAFWEFQHIGAELPLEPVYSVEKQVERFATALDQPTQDIIRPIIEKHRSSLEAQYPSKWKFATDNLILDADGRVAFIDNVKMGKRFFGYDIGWIIWPSWLHMNEAAWADVDRHAAYLDRVKTFFFGNIPANIEHPDNLDTAFNLIVFERLVGSLFDISNQTKHLASSGLGAEHTDRLHAHETFLRRMLDRIVERLW